MIATSSSSFIKEFTIYANKANEEGEIIFIQRGNDKNVILMSMDQYNDMKRELYELKKGNEGK